MRKKTTALFFCLFICCFCLPAMAARISGKVTDSQGNLLPYASILIKGTSKGTSTNQQGEYFLSLEAGEYILVCQYVGYARQEKKLTVTQNDQTVNFSLELQQTAMKEVVVKSGGEDPAYAIIRNAIKQKRIYRDQPDSFTCEAYIKTQMKLRKLPKRVLGQKIGAGERKVMGVDSSGKGIIYLSESLTRIAYKKPDHIKLEVVAGRESGSNGFGFNFPTFIDFYKDNVEVLTTQLSPRGFVSPIADGALGFYKYKYLGTFWEDGKAINQIKVIPRRSYEPLFAGTINITEGDWRIHSLELLLTKTSQLELLDTIRIKQIQVPVSPNVWRTQNQAVYFTFNQLGIDAVGNFVNVYSKYDLQPVFPKKYFDRVIMRYDTSVNKKTKQYWDSIRPVQLDPEEVKDYQVKDSLYEKNKDSTRQAIDSMRRQQGHVTPGNVLWNGFHRSDFNPNGPLTLYWLPLLKHLQYNTVEGVAANVSAVISKSFKGAQKQLSFAPNLRYGFSNRHFNAWGTLQWSGYGNDWDAEQSPRRTVWQLSGGKRVSQFNNANPISPLMNEVYTLLFRKNYLKLYENYFGKLFYSTRFDNDLQVSASLLYEDRLPLENTTDYSIFKNNNVFTPNYPYEKIPEQFSRHQAVIAGIGLQYQPGQRYIQFPRRRVAIGSSYPTFSLQYQKGLRNLLGSDVDFDKWKFSVWDNVNLKLYGQFKYRFAVGGFLNRNSVYIQDYQHFNGNRLIFASDYLNSFQLAPYYSNSTTASFYAEGHIEHHFNGMLTNKIPLFKKLNWHLVAAGNAFYVNKDNNYVEISAGLENILKILRVDLVGSYLNGKNGQLGVRIGLGGLLGGSIETGSR